MQDALLGDLIANTKKNMKKAKATGQPDSIGINDIGIYEFVFQGLPNLPDLEDMDEDRLFEIQRHLQEQLHKRDKERERNITKRVKEIPPPSKGEKPKQTRGRGKPKGKPQGHRQNPPKDQEADEAYTYDNPNNYYHNDNYTAPGQN